MAFDNHANLAVSTVAVLPSPAASGTSLTVASGEGARFPAAPFNATIAPIAAQPTPANAEIVRVTARTGDVFTLARAQEGTTARTVQLGDLIAATITAKTLTDIETPAGVNIRGSYSPLTFYDTSGPVDQRTWRIFQPNDGRFVIDALNDAQTVAQGVLLLGDRAGNARIGGSVSEAGRTTPMGYWIDFTPNIYSTDAGTTAVLQANYGSSYALVGKTLTFSVYILVTVTGAPVHLYMTLPESLICAKAGFRGGVMTYLGGVGGMASLSTTVGTPFCDFLRDFAGTPWPAGANQALGFGTAIPIQ